MKVQSHLRKMVEKRWLGCFGLTRRKAEQVFLLEVFSDYRNKKAVY